MPLLSWVAAEEGDDPVRPARPGGVAAERVRVRPRPRVRAGQGRRLPRRPLPAPPAGGAAEARRDRAVQLQLLPAAGQRRLGREDPQGPGRRQRPAPTLHIRGGRGRAAAPDRPHPARRSSPRSSRTPTANGSPRSRPAGSTCRRNGSSSSPELLGATPPSPPGTSPAGSRRRRARPRTDQPRTPSDRGNPALRHRPDPTPSGRLCTPLGPEHESIPGVSALSRRRRGCH